MVTQFPEEDDDYEVGYGKPPKQSRFQKGQSGNPHGRPKKKKSRQELFDEAWQAEVIIGGKKMTKAELFVQQLVNDGIKGKASARNLAIGYLPDAEDELEEFDPSLDDKIEMMKTVQRYQKRETNESDEPS